MKHLAQFVMFFLLLGTVLPAPFEVPLRRQSALPRQEVQGWLEKTTDGMENGQVEMPSKPKCPFRSLEGVKQLLGGSGDKNAMASPVPVSDFVDTFLVGEIAVGSPPQKFNVILDSTMFLIYGVPANFLIDAKTCHKGQNLPCEKMALFNSSKSTSFSMWPSVKGNTFAKDIVRFGNVQAESHFLLLNGKDFVGSRSFDLIYSSGALNLPRLDGIFSLAFTSSLMPVKSGMEQLLAKQESKIATVYIEPLKALDFFAQQNGLITVGGLDTQRCGANYEWMDVPMMAQRWKVPMKSMEFGTHKAKGGAAFFSTFHTFIYGPKEALKPLLELVKPIKNPIDGKEPKDVAIECDRSNLPDLKFNFGTRQFALTPEQYVLDVVLDPKDLSKNICHLMVRPIPEDLPDIAALMRPNDWFFGQLFFNQFCVAFDYTARKQKIGLSPHL